MYDLAIIWDWVGFAVRWVHVITAIAWIGSSFYFIALDLGLRKVPDLPKGAAGEEWQVHGGGFYHIQKYLVAPAEMPDHLTWFKWESYATWLSGFALLAVVYYVGADLYLVDPSVLDVSASTAIMISLASIGVGWVVYDLLCKSPLGVDNTKLMVLLYVVLVAMAWGYTQLFTGRAAFVHLGAFTATIMSANVFLIIIPNQEKVVASLKAGEQPDPALGAQAKQRSTHNNYLTLPILFLMLSNHYPLAFATEYNWIIASLVFLMGVTIRHYFNSKHARTGDPVWTWLATAILFVIIMWLSMTPKALPEEEEQAMSPTAQKFAASEMFTQVHEAVAGRCSMCHAAEPAWDGMHWAPKGVLLETETQIAERAREIYLHAGVTNAMPPANVSFMEPSERKLIQAWYRGVTSGETVTK
ncbi:MAG: urate hydroxylase PuuD [Alphaproteobacteria bacterium]|nr:urate hydroxylase PuuD [Alphaproteobacteria bacterium]